MTLMILGIALIVVALVLDFVFRLRITRTGDKSAMFLGGAFDYRKYHAVRRQYGWPAWPVYLMWALIILGLIFLVTGFFRAFPGR
jgi:hypothetical protein